MKLHGVTGACWPDPDPQLPGEGVHADDVTRLNRTAVSQICMAHSEEDVVRLLQRARSSGLRVCLRGTQHSMGGQCIASESLVLDLKRLDHIRYDESTETVTCGTGCTWADLIRHLNEFGMSPHTMQSYSTFSVGGTIAVNGHGITTDLCLVRSVKSFRLVRWDGTVTVCGREAASQEGRELFSLAIGGYGLFGVITEVELLTCANAHLELEKISLGPRDFAACFAGVQQEDVGLKMARLNVHNTESMDLFIFRKAQRAAGRTVSKLGRKPREMPLMKQLMYKWVMPNAQKLRYEYEEKAGVAIDWSGALERNTMMYVSADSVAKLYEPLWKVDDTFVLQEFFVPRSAFEQWISSTKLIYEELAAHPQLRLLNTTIRFVERDSETLLSYASHPEGMFAFVLYYRLPRTEEADRELARFHRLFVAATLKLEGSFYLPYRFHYSHEEVRAAYGKVEEFFRMKERYDPFFAFDSLWFRQYGLPYVSSGYVEKFPPAGFSLPRAPVSSIPAVPARLPNAFRTLLKDHWLRREFVDGFLVQTFSVVNSQQLYRLVAKCAWHPCNDTDLKIYAALCAELALLKGPVHEATRAARSLWQLSCQKRELARETASIVARLGLVGQLRDLVSVGDHGKMVLPLRQALGLRGKAYVVHRSAPETLEVVAERGALEAPGELVPWELRQGGRFEGLPDGAADLLTMNQGLHHMPPAQLPGFLEEVKRVLRPGGLFIFREHDCSEQLRPMLEIAHSVFNAVTGVPVESEASELRHFRAVAEWRAIVEGAGFEDSWLCAMEKGDPTFDEMLCFRKPGMLPRAAPPPLEVAEERQGLPPQLAMVLDTSPQMLLAVARDLLGRLATFLPQAADMVRSVAKTVLSSGSAVVEKLTQDVLQPLSELLEKTQELLQGVELQDASESLGEYFPPELFVLASFLLRKADSGEASANELFLAGLLRDVKAALASFGDKGSAAAEPVDEELSEAAGAFSQAVPAAEVEQVLTRLFLAFPMLRDPKYVDSMGFDRRARSAMKERFGTPVAEMAAKLAGQLDDIAWAELKLAFHLAEEQGRPPTAALLFNGESPWSQALQALLGSPKVRLSSAACMGLQFVGLGDVVRLWRLAQAKRQEGRAATALVPQGKQERERQALLNVAKAVEGMEPKVRRCQFDGNVRLRDVHGVSEVLSARFGYESLTASYVDVTEEVRERCLQNGTLRLADVDLAKVFGDKFCANKRWDNFRKSLLCTSHKLLVEYRAVDPDPEEFMPKVNGLLDFLSSCGLTEELHVEDGHYTWYKLTEWMQVEMMQIFGHFLDTSVWYRFPYTQYLRVYFEVLYAEMKIVKERFGTKAAFASSAFVTSFVPGIMMTALMGQLQLLALPLKAMPNEIGFGEERDSSKLYEQLVVQVPRKASAPHWPSVHSGLWEVKALVSGLHVLRSPTQKELTNVILALARVPGLRLLEVSNQRHIQVRVLLTEPGLQLAQLNGMKGCQVMLQFEYPTPGMAGPGTSVALCVTVPYLLSTVRACGTVGIKVLQVYDFWR